MRKRPRAPSELSTAPSAQIPLSESATAERRQRLVQSLSRRSADSRRFGSSAGGGGSAATHTATDDSDDSDDERRESFFVSPATLVEQLFMRLEHHGVQRCEDALPELHLDDEDHQEGFERTRRPHYYLCVPCEFRMTAVLTAPPTQAMLAAAVYHCSSAQHRLYARYMSLPEIDASLATSAVPSPGLYSSIVVNGVRVLVCKMPGSSEIFHPLPYETEAAVQAADERFFQSRSCSASDSHATLRKKIPSVVFQEYALQRQSHVLRQMRAAAAHQEASSNNAAASAQLSKKVCAEKAATDNRLLPTEPGCDGFLYNPILQFVDPDIVCVPCDTAARRTLRRQNRRSSKTSSLSGATSVRSLWTRVPTRVVNPSVALEYQLVALRPKQTAAAGRDDGGVVARLDALGGSEKQATDRISIGDDDEYRLTLRASVTRRTGQPNMEAPSAPHSLDQPVTALTQESLALLDSYGKEQVSPSHRNRRASGHIPNGSEISFFDMVRNFAVKLSARRSSSASVFTITGTQSSDSIDAAASLDAPA